MSIVDKYEQIKKSLFNDSNRPEAEPRKGLFAFANALIQKKQQKPFVLNAQTLDRLAKTDPITWAIIRTIKSRVNNTRWDIVPDTERIEKELDRWEEYAVESLNPYGLQDEPFTSKLIDDDVFKSTGVKLDKILKDSTLNPIQKNKAIRWIFKSVKRQINYIAQEHCEVVRPIFEKPNTSAETSLRALQELIINDLLIYDAGVIVKNYSVSGNLAELYTLPGHEIKIYRNEDRTTPQPPEPAYVWEDNGILRAEFTNEELVYIMMNPTQIGYGISPLEVAAYIITASLFAEQYNIDYFKNSNVPPGVFSLGEKVTEEQKRLFQTLWDNEVQGRAGGLHRMLFMAGGDPSTKFIPLQSLSNRDMEMMEYLRWTVSIKCACYGLTPQDIGFTQDFKGMGSGGVADVQKQLSESRGITSILQLLEQYYNAEIVKSEFGFTDIKFEWLKDDDEDDSKQGTVDNNDITNGVLSRNERRNKLGLKPIPGGDIVTITATGGALPVPVENLELAEETTVDQEVSTTPENPDGTGTAEPEDNTGGQAETGAPAAPTAPEAGVTTEKGMKKARVRVTVNKKLSDKNKKLDSVVKKLKDSGIDAELRIGFKSDDVTK